MDPASFGIAVFSLAESTVKITKKIYEIRQSYQNARQDVPSAVLVVQSVQSKLEAQMAYLRGNWNKLPARMQNMYNLQAAGIERKLEDCMEIVESVETTTKVTSAEAKDIFKFMRERHSTKLAKDGAPPAVPDSKRGPPSIYEIKRWKYAVLVKTRLDDAINELKELYNSFDVSWYILLNLPSSIQNALQPTDAADTSRGPLQLLKAIAESKNVAADANLSRASVIQDAQFVDDTPDDSLNFGADIQLSTTRLTGKPVILDRMSSMQNLRRKDVHIDVSRLGQLLMRNQLKACGLLPCLGVVRTKNDLAETTSYTFVFSLDPMRELKGNLRDCLKENQVNNSLNMRLKIARELSRAVLVLHTWNFVHKNIRPENIVLSSRLNASEEKQCIALLGFRSFRGAEELSVVLVGDENSIANLYRHPRRQGLRPEDTYRMQHDIYSLGVCLLEIGLWSSLPTRFIPYRTLNTTAQSIQADLCSLARTSLPSAMGNKYCEIVTSCLTCLDGESTLFTDISVSDSLADTSVAVRYAEEILLRLHSIQL